MLASVAEGSQVLIVGRADAQGRLSAHGTARHSDHAQLESQQRGSDSLHGMAGAAHCHADAEDVVEVSDARQRRLLSPSTTCMVPPYHIMILSFIEDSERNASRRVRALFRCPKCVPTAVRC